MQTKKLPWKSMDIFWNYTIEITQLVLYHFMNSSGLQPHFLPLPPLPMEVHCDCIVLRPSGCINLALEFYRIFYLPFVFYRVLLYLPHS